MGDFYFLEPVKKLGGRMTRSKLLLLVIGFAFFGNTVVAQQSIFFNNIQSGTNINPSVAGFNPYTGGQVINTNITVSGIGKAVVAGLNGFNSMMGYGCSGWPLTATIDPTKYFEWTMTPNTHYKIHLAYLVYTGLRTTTGPTLFSVRSSADGFTSDIYTLNNTLVTSVQDLVDLSGAAFSNITSAITFRFYAWNASATAGRFSILDFDFGGEVYTTNSITTSAAGPFTLPTCASSLSSTVSFTSTGSFDGTNTYSAQLSDETGSFAAPTVIGTLVSGANSGSIPITIPAGTNGSANYKVRVVSNSPDVEDVPSLGLTQLHPVNVTINSGYCTTHTTDYFRSNSATFGGDWNTVASWESSETGAAPWKASTIIPTEASSGINIQSGDIITISSAVEFDQLSISGTLDLLTGGLITFNDGTGVDISILSGGNFRMQTTDAKATAFTYIGSPSINVATGGKITIGTGGPVGLGYDNFGTSSIEAIWNTGAIFDWNSSTTFNTSGVTYFPNAASGTIPIFRVTSVGGIPGTGALDVTTVNGLLEVNSSFTFTNNFVKTFRDGIQGTATLTQEASSGAFKTTSATAVLDGSVTIILSSQMTCTNGITVPLGANVKVSGPSVTRTSGNFLVNGTINVDTTTLVNTTGNVTVNGTLKTAKPQGFSGTSCTIVSGTINLNAGSTIEYNALGNQAVTTRADYQNLKFSGSGTKTLNGAFNPNGTVTITGLAIVNQGSNSFGDATTSLTMNGGRLIMTGARTSPDITGTYTLTGGVLEYANNSITGQTIRSPRTYDSIEVTGAYVGNSVGTISLASGGAFTVKPTGRFTINSAQITAAAGSPVVTVESGGIFYCGNSAGFSGAAASTSINSSITNINLNTGSTVDYIRAGDQPITNQVPYYHLVLSGTGNRTAASGVITVNGDLTKPGTNIFVHNSGTILLNGTTQSFAGLNYNNLILANSGTKTTSGSSTINDSLKISTGTTLAFSTNDTIYLHSDAVKTARLAQLDGTISYGTNGKFVVERYISSGRKWRFLSIPTNTAQTVKASWMEGNTANGNTLSGYGTIITDTSATWSVNGFDSQSITGPSMKYYNPVTNIYPGIANTGVSINAQNAYMCFVRGDRSALPGNATLTSTVLRTIGQLKTGTLSFPVGSNQFGPIGNPYASAVDLRKIDTSNITDFIYLWDPKLGGTYNLGAFQTLSKSGSNYIITPGGGSYPSAGSVVDSIESGQAFFVKSKPGGGSVGFKETAKTFGARQVFFVPTAEQTLRANLYIVENGNPVLQDGVMANFGSNYSNTVDVDDGIKMENNGEMVAFKRDNSKLAIERRHSIVADDSLYLNLGGLRQISYRWQISGVNMDQPGLDAWLLDAYKGISTPIDLIAGTDYDFTTDNIPGSYAPNRFTIVFKPPVPVPVNFIAIHAQQQQKTVVVDWKVGNEINIDHYEVDRAADGLHFEFIGSVRATGNTDYTWIDQDPIAGNDFYRVRSIGIGNEIRYSPVVKVVITRDNGNIVVYPNPVTGQLIELRLNDQPAGKYSAKLFNTNGQLVYSGQFSFTGGSGSVPIQIPVLSKGIYRLEIWKPDGTKLQVQLAR